MRDNQTVVVWIVLAMPLSSNEVYLRPVRRSPTLISADVRSWNTKETTRASVKLAAFSRNTGGSRVSCEVACFEHKVDFMAAINRLGAQGERTRKLGGVGRADRNC